MKLRNNGLFITATRAISIFVSVAIGCGVFAKEARALQFSFSYEYESITASGILETTDNLLSVKLFGENYDAYQILGITNGLRNGVTMNLLPPRSYIGNDNFIIPQLTSSNETIGPFFSSNGFSFLAGGNTYAVYSNGFRLIETQARLDGGIGANNFINSFSVTPVSVSPVPVPEPSTLLGCLVYGGGIFLWKKIKSARSH